MDLGLEGKVAWVLGSSSGLGLACARSLAGEGARVVMSARSADVLDAAVKGITDEGGIASALPLDVLDAPGIAAAATTIAAEHGPVEILIANAGGPPAGSFDAHDDDTLAGAFELTIASAWRLTKAVLPHMRAAGSGCILYMTSWSTKEVIPGLLLSNMMRAAVVGMAKTLSKELGPHGIRVLCVAPGRFDTPRLHALDQRTADSSALTIEEVAEASQASIPLGRYGSTGEFGDAVAFLASPRASYISGVNVLIDGGMLNGVLS